MKICGVSKYSPFYESLDTRNVFVVLRTIRMKRSISFDLKEKKRLNKIIIQKSNEELKRIVMCQHALPLSHYAIKTIIQVDR